MKKLNNNVGVTLIALIVTIVVLLILAGVALNSISGGEQIVEKASEAKNSTDLAGLREEVDIALSKYKGQINTSNNLDYYLNKINNVSFQKVANDTYVVTRGSSTVTVTLDGEVVMGKTEIWDGTSVTAPEIANNEIHIYTCDELKWLEQQVNVEHNYFDGYTVFLENDLDFGARPTSGNWETEVNEALEWTPIGIKNSLNDKSQNDYLKAPFKGQNHTIKGIYINETTDKQGIGLFGVCDSVENLTIKNSYIKGKQYVGGIAGYVIQGTVQNCNNVNTKVIAYDNAGGIAAIVYKGTIKNCKNSGYVEAENSTAGGVIGWAYIDSNIENCGNTGEVTSKYRTGGVVGSLENNSIVKNSYNTGTVVGKNGGHFTGGIAGVVPVIWDYEKNASTNKSNATIEKCYNSGDVYGVQRVGGIAGCLQGGNTTVKEVYNKGKVIPSSTTGSDICEIFGDINYGDNLYDKIYYLKNDRNLPLYNLNPSYQQEVPITETEDDIKSYEQFITWIAEQE